MTGLEPILSVAFKFLHLQHFESLDILEVFWKVAKSGHDNLLMFAGVFHNGDVV